MMIHFNFPNRLPFGGGILQFATQRPRERTKRKLTEMSQEQNIERTLDQDFVAPAPCHMPIEVLSVRVRGHPHEERTPSGVVFWTGSDEDAE